MARKGQKMIAIYIPDALERGLKKIAKKRVMSVSEVLRNLIVNLIIQENV